MFNSILTNKSRSTHCINKSMLNKAYSTVGYQVQKEDYFKQIRTRKNNKHKTKT